MNNPLFQPIPALTGIGATPYEGILFNGDPAGIFGNSATYGAIAGPTSVQGLQSSFYNGNIADFGMQGAGFMPGSMGPSPGTTPATGGWMDKMNGAWSKYGDMIQGIGGIMQAGVGMYGMLQNIRLAKRQFEHQRKGDILSYNMMVQNQRNYQEDRADINAGAAKARGRYVTTEAERQAEVDRRSVPMWDAA
jgi:hypothetical protein